jgi:hypothetical protein
MSPGSYCSLEAKYFHCIYTLSCLLLQPTPFPGPITTEKSSSLGTGYGSVGSNLGSCFSTTVSSNLSLISGIHCRILLIIFRSCLSQQQEDCLKFTDGETNHINLVGNVLRLLEYVSEFWAGLKFFHDSLLCQPSCLSLPLQESAEPKREFARPFRCSCCGTQEQPPNRIQLYA